MLLVKDKETAITFELSRWDIVFDRLSNHQLSGKATVNTIYILDITSEVRAGQLNTHGWKKKSLVILLRTSSFLSFKPFASVTYRKYRLQTIENKNLYLQLFWLVVNNHGRIFYRAFRLPFVVVYSQYLCIVYKVTSDLHLQRSEWLY